MPLGTTGRRSGALTRRQRPGSPAERIEIITFHEGKRLHTVRPTTTEQAQYSLPWAVACAVQFGTVDVHGITEALNDSTVQALAERVVVQEDDTFNDRLPQERWASARLHLKDGITVESVPHEALGNPTNPLSDDDIVAKFHALADPALGEAHAHSLRHVVDTLETRPVRDLLNQL
ncbi:MmgE/PrpD family protein [Aidingimonas lacisalsi]|uniref:MmgE/PrpD family protein n=1 Tax=Aidingimonas lacisalsi TaxID=2604086 RepID=UPI001F32D447|nr:MmgE/PrpD family protein [Aidingimonas lacisalsi]